MKKILFTILFFTFSYASLFAERNKIKQTNIWLKYRIDLNLPKKTKLYLDLEDRVLITPVTRNYLSLWRLGAEKQFKSNWSIGGGIYNGYTGTNNVYNMSEFVVPEIRPYADVSYKQNISDIFNIYHRYRVEWRFVKNISQKYTQSDESFKNNFRFRYFIGFTAIPFKQKEKELSLTIYDEILINAGKSIQKNIFDQNRLGFALKYKFNKIVGSEISYFYNIQQKSNGDDTYNCQIIKFTIYNNFDIQKKEKK